MNQINNLNNSNNLNKAPYKKITAEEVCDFIEKAESALIICHKNPDSDTVGSAMALREIFSLLNKKSKIVCDSAPGEYLDFITSGESFEYAEGDEEKYSSLISVDVASPSQLGLLSFLVGKIAMSVDHHDSGEPFADNLTEPSAAAAGEIIFKIYEILKERNKIPQSPNIARYLYAALSGDTGSFKYSNTTPDTFLVASKLCREINSSCDGGMKTDEISRYLHDCVSYNEMKARALLTENVRFFENGTIAVCTLTREIMEKNGISDGDTSAAVDVPRKIKGVLVAVALKQSKDDGSKYRVSARANCDINVANVCRDSFSGGGHVRAAGGEMSCECGADAALYAAREFFSAVREYLIKNKDKGVFQ